MALLCWRGKVAGGALAAALFEAGDADGAALAAPHTRLEHNRHAFLYNRSAPYCPRAPCGRLHPGWWV